MLKPIHVNIKFMLFPIQIKFFLVPTGGYWFLQNRVTIQTITLNRRIISDNLC